MAGSQIPIGRNAGGHGEAGMESEEGTAFEGVTKPAKYRGIRKVSLQDKNIFLCEVAFSSDTRLRRLEHLGTDCHLVHSTSVSGCKPSLPS